MQIDGAKLKEARTAAGLTVVDVANASGMGERAYRYKEAKGGRTNMNVAKAIARKLGVKVEDLK